MKKFLLLLFPFLFFSNANAQIVTADASSPIMTFDSLVYHFGEVVQGTNVIHEFQFKNTGKSPLIIESVNCPGPTQADYSRDPVAPGKTGTIRLHCLTQGKSGPMFRTVTVQSNSRDGSIVLSMKGSVILPQPVLKFDSTSYTFGKVKQGETVHLELHFTNTGKEPLIITNCTTACGCDVATAPHEAIKPGESGIIKYTLDTKPIIGMQSKTITIIYNTNQNLVIHIRGEVVLN